MATQREKPRGLTRLVPALEWLPWYDRGWLRGDLTASVAVTALVVPKNLGYAGIAGIPLQNGLYPAASGAIIYALAGTSRQIPTGPSSSLAAVAGSAVLVTGLGEKQAAELVAAITLATGVLFLLLALLRRGWGTQVFRDLDQKPDAEKFPGIPVVRLDGGLSFATAEALEERIRGLFDAEPAPRALVLEADGIVELVGASHIDGNVDRAIEAELAVR